MRQYPNEMTHELRLGYPVLWAIVFARQVCLPVPAVLFLMTAGAMARKGDLNFELVLCAGVLGCLCGDMVWFEAGRFWGSRIMRILSALSDNPQRAERKSKELFGRWGLRVLMVAKFVPGLDGVTPPLAGVEGASRGQFLSFDAVGSLLWSLAYAGCGFLFAERLEAIATSLANFGSLLAVVVGIPLLCYVLWRAWVILRMLQRLKMRRISPLLLKSKMDQGEPIVVIDLLNFEEAKGKVAGIAGAVRIDPARLSNRSKVTAPEGTQIVLYCSTSGEFRSARVAVSLRRKGLSAIWVLDGGLKGWLDAGLPVTFDLKTEHETAERFGIRILDEGAVS